MPTVTEPTQSEVRWLRCHLAQGMFSDEVAVTYPPEGQWQKSVFVDRQAVEGSAGDIGKVRVSVLRRNGAILAVLPSPEGDIVYAKAEDISG